MVLQPMDQDAANRAVLIETQQTKRSQSAIFNSRTSPSGGAASNFTKRWRQPTKNVEIGSNTAGSNKVSKIPSKNQPVLSKGETLVVEEMEDLDFLVEELEDQDLLVEVFEDQDLLVEDLEDHDVGQPIFDNYIEEQTGEEGKEMSDSIKYVAEPVYDQSMDETTVIVEEEKDLSLGTTVMQVQKQKAEDDRQHKDYVLCEKEAMNGFHLLQRLVVNPCVARNNFLDKILF
ncbi:hypothetical protein SO802_018401 [Lithocarpus litseifolius]|uniref:Uncharacterized protein n=1 Tax=Lithocarpus litseifolius TaxID=425828 RepID=A0AAW2CL93_9ROSI